MFLFLWIFSNQRVKTLVPYAVHKRIATPHVCRYRKPRYRSRFKREAVVLAPLEDMKYVKLGRTGLDCSRLGFGTWQIGGGRWKAVDPEKSVALLRHAVECGVNIFDAAIVYGQYREARAEQRSHALELLGQAFFGERRPEVIICLKVGQIDEYSHRAIYEPHNMVEQIRRALKQLRTDYLDICLVHAPTISEIRDGRALSVVQTIQALGVSRFVGYSFEAEPEHARLALDQGIDVIMLQYNLLDQQCAEVFDIAANLGVGVLVGGPFKRGYLSGQYEKPEDLPQEDDYWAWNLRYARRKVEDLLLAATELRNRAGGATELRRSALHHIFRHQGASCAIVGHRTIQEITENADLIDEIFPSAQTITSVA